MIANIMVPYSFYGHSISHTSSIPEHGTVNHLGLSMTFCVAVSVAIKASDLGLL